MRNILGGVLIVLGVAMLAFGSFSYTETKPVLKAGPLEVNTEEEHHVSIPAIGGVIVLLAGVGVLFVRRTS